MFRRKKWKYLILDEAHMIKNWKSSALADAAQLQLPAPPTHHGDAPAERSHGALVADALPYAPGIA